MAPPFQELLLAEEWAWSSMSEARMPPWTRSEGTTAMPERTRSEGTMTMPKGTRSEGTMTVPEGTKLLKRSSLKLGCLLSLLGLLQLSSKVRTLPSKLAGAPQDPASASVAEAAGHASEAERRVAVPDGVSAHAGLPPAELAQSPAPC